MSRPGEAIDRDLRLDACRGIALWFVFLDHVPDNVCGWLTLQHYGFSDTTEVFMFVSGVTCALMYGSVQRVDGWGAVISHTLRRGWEIYTAFLTLIVAIAVLVFWVGDGPLADQANVRVLLEHPGEALAHAALLQYRPANTDVLPVFVLFHLMFAPLLWLLRKAPHATIAGSAALYLLVQIFGWNLPAWPRNDWYFNPLAWQFLVVLGAWWVMAGRKWLPSLTTSRFSIGLAAMYLVFSLVIVLGWSVAPLKAAVPRFLAELIYPVDKTDLDPLRLLHFLAIAIVVANVVPSNWRGLATPVLRGAIRCGENSLEIYCLGVLLAFAAQAALDRVSDSIAAQIGFSITGVLLLVAFATVSTWVSIGSRRQPRLL